MKRMAVIALLALMAAPAIAQDAAPPPAQAPSAALPPAAQAPSASPPPAAPFAPPPPERVYATQKVALQTSLGTIVLALEKERAPATSANFLKYVDQKRFDGTGFYRTMRVAGRDDIGLIQAGTRGVSTKNLRAIAHEPTSKTGLSHTDGAISMARLAPGTAAGDFFIILGGLPSLDANPQGKGDTAGFAVFGRVVEGMDVVRKIHLAPTSPTEGAGVMKGQMIAAPVKILGVKRVK